MAKYCYAIRKGRKRGIVYSWDECSELVRGYAGAEYQGFNTDEEALAWLEGNSVATNKSTGEKVCIQKPASELEVNLYTDGSFKNDMIAFGVFIESLNRGFKFYGVVSCPQYASIRNIAGELLAVLTGVQLANNMGFKKINIFYDQLGVEYWYNGTWTARGQLQQIYVALLNQLRLSNDLTLNFLHTKAHNGVSGNVVADKMASRASNFKHYVDLDAILRGNITVRDVPLFG